MSGISRGGWHSVASFPGSSHLEECLGDKTMSLDNAIKQATPFILACYGQTKCKSMTEVRQKMWSTKVSQSMACAPKLNSLPPTNEAFKENVARAHLQAAVWRNTLEANPPALDPTTCGWSQEEGSKSLTPVTVPDNTPLAPVELLKLIKCSCSSEMPCKHTNVDVVAQTAHVQFSVHAKEAKDVTMTALSRCIKLNLKKEMTSLSL
jgi:hypothetical protein